MIFREILAGSLRLNAERLLEMSRSHPEPNGWQARAQAVEAKERLDWGQAEQTAADSSRDFDTRKLSREEVIWAIHIAEEKTKEFMELFIELHEQEHGPIGDLAVALEREPGNFKETPEQEKAIQRWGEYKRALFELQLVLKLF